MSIWARPLGPHWWRRFMLNMQATPVTTADINIAYTGFTATATGGSAPYTYALDGTWPTGITINASTGAVTGTPTQSGVFGGVAVKVTDAYGLTFKLPSFSLTVATTVGIAAGVTPPPTATVGLAYIGFTCSATGGTAPRVFALVGTWPSGLSVDPALGIVSGTPTQSGTFANLSISVTDRYGGTASITPFSLNVAGATTVQSLGMMGGQMKIGDAVPNPTFVDLMDRARTYTYTSGPQLGNEGMGRALVLSMARTSGQVNVVLTAAPGDNPGDFVMKSGMLWCATCIPNPTFDADHLGPITVTDQTHFSYAQPGTDATAILSHTNDVPACLLGQVALGSNGSPIEDHKVILAATVGPSTSIPDLNGTYNIIFPSSLPTGLTFSAGALTWAGGSTGTLVLSGTNTQALIMTVTGTPTDGSYVNPRIIRNDHDQSGVTVIRPDFKVRMSSYAQHRWMDGAKTTSNAAHKAWANRPLRSVGTGLPFEKMVDACNEANGHAWFNIPVTAKDDYVTGMATLIRSRLNSALDAIYEFSNEPWNPAFLQWHWMLAMAKDDIKGILHGVDTLAEIASITGTAGTTVVVLNHNLSATYVSGLHIDAVMQDTTFNASNVVITKLSANSFSYPSAGAGSASSLNGLIVGNLASNLLSGGLRDIYLIRERFWGRRLYECGQLIKAAYSGVLNGRAKMVYMHQLANFGPGVGSLLTNVFPWLEATYGVAINTWLYAIGGAPYAVGIGTPASACTDAMKASIDTQVASMHAIKYLAVKYNLAGGVMHYEIGPDMQDPSNTAGRVDAVYVDSSFRTAMAYILNKAYAWGAKRVNPYTTDYRWTGTNGTGSWGVGPDLASSVPVGSATAPKQQGIDDVLQAAPPAIADTSRFPGTTQFVSAGNATVFDASFGGFNFNGTRCLDSANAWVENLIFVPATGTVHLTIWGKYKANGGNTSTNALRVYIDGISVGTLALFTDGTDVTNGPAGQYASPTTLTVTGLTAGDHIVRCQGPVDPQPDRMAVSQIVAT